jgi:prepilin-type N-terminal cleavage/methylation domain-containing protein
VTESITTQFSYSNAKGFTLMELMIAVGVLGVIMAVAIPVYTDYIDTARVSVMTSNLETIRLFEEDFRLSEGVYVAGTYDPADPDAAGGLKAGLGWEPRTGEDTITYVVDADTVTATGYIVVATDSSGRSVTLTCNNRKCAVSD